MGNLWAWQLSAIRCGIELQAVTDDDVKKAVQKLIYNRVLTSAAWCELQWCTNASMMVLNMLLWEGMT
uniref:Uncharacterized protein n=1 Tax=Hyaloperonospora arabidopsidis (strain Emoy2) TaxID=559515 RepID=M4BS22_HYAAE